MATTFVAELFHWRGPSPFHWLRLPENACEDVRAQVRRLRARGIALMPVPDNYYVDLAARFPLTSEEVADLREHQVLYDRIGEGELLHVYTDVLPAGFYVELLERRGGYDAYGSVNTQVRLAVQRRAPSYAALGGRNGSDSDGYGGI